MSKTRMMIAELNEQAQQKIALLEANQLLIDGIATDCVESIEFTTFQLTTTLDICFAGKAADLSRVWKVLRRRGFKPDFNVTEKSASFSTFWRSEDTELVIWLHFTSRECTVVRVGTKMVEQAVYEVQCDSELAELGV